MRTLVVSDLHLGARLGRDVLRRPAALAALLEAVDSVDRLVLLGDVVELLEGPARTAIRAAEPVLHAIGARMGAAREIVVVPGNHDRALLRPWLQAHGGPATLDAVVPHDAGPLLARVTAALGPASVTVRYPGVWLGDRVWATHGHYLDHHLLPQAAYGVITRGRGWRTVAPRDYERAGGPSLAGVEGHLTRWLPRPLAALAEDVAELLRAATMPSAQRPLRAHRLARLNAAVLGTQMQRASLPALGMVLRCLEVDAAWTIFGHVHRRGPLPGDVAERWSGLDGRPGILNTGSWVYERRLLHGAGPPHPYWPGGAVCVDGDADPRSVGLLDHLDAAALQAPLPR